MKIKSSFFATLIFVFILGVGALVAIPQKVGAAPVTFTVNSTGDGSDVNGFDGICQTSTPGECTLRAAIEQANSNGNASDQDVIEFGISGTGLHTINQTGLYYFITEPLLIDGYSQNGSAANTAPWPDPFDGNLTIEVDSSSHVGTLAAFIVSSTNVSMRGLVLNGSPDSAILVESVGDDFSLKGSYVGTDSTGLIADYTNGAAISINGSDGLTIGGSDPEDRNIIAANGKQLYAVANDTVVRGNYFGVGADGVTSLPSPGILGTSNNDFVGDNIQIGGTNVGEGNTFEGSVSFASIYLEATNSSILGNRISGNFGGVAIGESDNVIVGDGTLAGRNVISGNDLSSFGDYGDGISVNSGDGAVSIKGNYIGVAEDGVTSFGNMGHGIGIGDARNVGIGGTTAGEENIIANNAKDGINVSNNVNGNSASMLGNSIHDNGGLGINLLASGENANLAIPTPNDDLDADNGGNDLLNAPKLLPPIVSGSDTDISYRLDIPAGDYRVEFFSNTAYDPSGYGEGESLIGSDVITSSGAGPQLFTATVSGNTHANISATVTEIDGTTNSGYGPTSEFSGLPAAEANTSVTKSIVDQTTIATAGTIQYNVSFTNTGLDPIDVSEYVVDGGDPLNTALLNELFPDNLTLDSVAGGLDCSEQNPSESFDPLLAGHTNYTVASCSFDGVSPTLLQPDDSLNFVFTFSLTNPTPAVFDNYIIAVPGQTDDSYAVYQDALTSGNDIINEITGDGGAGSDNIAVATTTQPEADISITKELLTPVNNIAAGGTLSYELTYTNNGLDPLYLGDNDTPLGSNPLFYDYAHPDLRINAGSIIAADTPASGFNVIDVGNPNLACIETPTGFAVNVGFTKYGDYGFIACWYAGPDFSLASGDSFVATLNFDVNANSDLDFANYALASPNNGGTVDPDASAMDSAITSGEDSLDGLINYQHPINNFAVSRLPIDVTLSSQVLDPPATISEGTQVKYQVTIQNNGPAAFNFSHYVNHENAPLTSLFPGTSLEFSGVEDDLLVCLPLGPGTAYYLGSAASDHPDYELMTCKGNADIDDVVIPAGGSRSITLLFTAKSSVMPDFNFYSLNTSAQSDSDVPVLLGAILSATSDILDSISNNNYTLANFSGIVVSPPGGTSNGNSSGSSLTGTGEDRKRIAIIAVLILFAGGAALVVSIAIKKQRNNPKK